MNYEEAYKNALERAKKKLEDVVLPETVSANLLYDIFPELAESEDERIRAVILKLVLGMRDEIFTTADKLVTKPKVLSWLEKQKEQKPVQSEEEKEYVRTLKGLVSDFIRNSGGGITDVFYYQQICDWLDGRHIEQKPAEKQDYSGLSDLERAIHRGFLCAGVENVSVNIIKETAQDCLAQMKPAEWSEEDSDNLERVDNYLWMLDDYVGDDCAMPQGKTDKIRGNIQGILSSWLKSLPERFNLQPKQEWSEEDEKRVQSILFSIGYCKDEYSNKKDYSKDIDWLKSISPRYYGNVTMTEAYKMGKEAGEASHWKPSEEQIKALDKAIPVCMGVVGRDEIAPLESLYEDLKKL